MPFAYDKFTKRFVDDLNQAYKYFAIVVGRLILYATIQVGGLIVRASHAKKVYTQGDTHLDIDRIKSNLDLFTDIDECNIVPSVCDPNADCQNNDGSYLCSCQPGFIGDGKTCRGNMGK